MLSGTIKRKPADLFSNDPIFFLDEGVYIIHHLQVTPATGTTASKDRPQTQMLQQEHVRVSSDALHRQSRTCLTKN